MDGSLAGRLLLAAPTLRDPNFARTVVLVGVHNDDGAMGVVLNRPSEVSIGEAVPQLLEAVDEDERLFIGGPVAPTSVVCLAEFDDPARAELIVMGRIGFLASQAGIDELGDGTRRCRVFAGYAGWGEAQLEGEIERGDWIPSDPLPDDVFSDSAETLWETVLTRKGGQYALIARMPEDPSLN
ncbi:MAG TPA: YqgE/AlgH family protein [Solirubrobacteraceae bacterium]|jgi:putative transcriptional regulator|nr:YqgE/AlgH family protein [Solirubrobacteraceae bacterium]